MKRLVIHGFLLLASVTYGYNAGAQKIKISAKNFEGMWQVSMQKNMLKGINGTNDKFTPPRNRDFKVFDANGNFMHFFYMNDRYVQLSRGKIKITSDSTYTEELDKHIGVPPSVKEGHVVFKFLDDDTFLMNWTLNGANGEEIYERVK
ncbi:hypothetical protein A9P82_06040 [Arachidicoccus ginsenosidimutans]|uniref:DUF4488 domain-containing protein n=1 Tax=Arachidicoccus sp. BS20 TaxID=1850526 RepID=UPI0007F0D08E|nr:DUF4488 domain-containing protein [Arachidicoccus sp. BS20]ANI88892.1 hypothetical protein A9P82_06040 [Arachidicoccus sp. BS20]